VFLQTFKDSSDNNFIRSKNINVYNGMMLFSQNLLVIVVIFVGPKINYRDAYIGAHSLSQLQF